MKAFIKTEIEVRRIEREEIVLGLEVGSVRYETNNKTELPKYFIVGKIVYISSKQFVVECNDGGLVLVNNNCEIIDGWGGLYLYTKVVNNG